MQGTRRYGSDEAAPIDWIVQPNEQGSGPRGISSSGGGKGGRSKSSTERALTGPGLSEMFAYHATTMANTIRTSLIVFSRKVRPSGLHPHADTHADTHLRKI